MDSFGNRREIQQGEDWNLDILVSASDREYIPFIVSSERVNPYFVLTVASTKYEKNMRYVASWWNKPENIVAGESLPTFYQTTPVDIGVLSTAPTSSFKPEDIPSEYQTDESAEKRYLYRYMLESESVDEELGHRPYHYLYFEYPEPTAKLKKNFILGMPTDYIRNTKSIFVGYNDRLRHDQLLELPSTLVFDVGETTTDKVKACFEIISGGYNLYILAEDFDTPLTMPSDCRNMFDWFPNITLISFARTDFSKVTTMYGMLSEHYYLTTVSLGGVCVDKCQTMDRLFFRCNKLTRIYVNDTFLNQVDEKLSDGTLSTKAIFYGCPKEGNPDGYLTGRNGYWTHSKEQQYAFSLNVPYSEIYDCTLATSDTSLKTNIICHIDDYECHIRFNLDSDVTGEWNGQEYKYAITLVDGPTLVNTLQTIAMSNNGGVLPDDYPTSLEAQYKYVTTKYPGQLGPDIDVTSPVGKIQHPEPILRPTDLKVYNNLRKLI